MSIAALLLPDFLLILLGYLLCRHTALNRPVWQAVEGLVYFVLFPVLLFQSIVRTPLDWRAASGLMTAGLLTGLATIALAYALPHLPGLRAHISPREHAAAAQVAFRFNAFIGLALAERLLGAQGLQLIAVLIGVCVPLFNVAAVWPMARHARRSVAGELARNPLILATAAGLLASGLGIRHLAAPLVAWAVARALRLGAAETTVLLAFSALPTASSCYVLAVRMGYNGPYVAALVTLSTLLGMLSLPLALAVLTALPWPTAG